ncbi:type II secretion system protein GspM [Congregibacter litoralis]|uniref:Type II secretion system protein M n=1 Tax=Congregibacter litoralis KT71 TaxID=314285 RepID=A4A5K6_9GAMM|nr:type II secretion system protein M [Congregibacter litoralis]EAQ99077.1 Type II secretory pathway, component PulM [Congregibacter litoralis KT71]
MKDWFERYTLREQLALLAMALVVTLYLLGVFVIQPLGQARADLAARNTATAEALLRVDAMATEIRALEDTEGSTRGTRSANLSASLNQSAGRYALRVSRLQPNSQGSVQLRFESAPLDALLRWIHELETTQGLRVDDLSLSQTSTAGTVSATLRVAAGP